MAINLLTRAGKGSPLTLADHDLNLSTIQTAINNNNPSTTKGDLLVNNGTQLARLAVGTNAQVLTADSAEATGVKWAAASVANMEEYSTTASPVAPAIDNSTTVADYLIAIGDGAHINDSTEDNAVAIGQAYSLDGAVAIGCGDKAAPNTYYAQGRGAVQIGGWHNNIVASPGGVIVGARDSILATTPYSAIVGGELGVIYAPGAAVVGGYNNDVEATADYALAHGYTAFAKMFGERCHGYDGTVAFTQCHLTEVGGGLNTTNATPTEIPLSSASDFILLTNDTSYIFKCFIVARNIASDTTSACWEVTFGIRRGTNAANTALIGAVTKTVVGADAGAATWDVDITADTTNGRPSIKAVGQAATNIYWAMTCFITTIRG